MSTHKRNGISGIVPKMGHSIDKILADNLNLLFEQRGITSAATAESALKVPKSTIDRAWHQRSMARVDTVADLAVALKLEPWQLLVPGLNPARPPKLAEDGVKQAVALDQFNADELIELLAILQQASQREREHIIGIARSVARGNLKWRRV